MRKDTEHVVVIQCDPGQNQGSMNERGLIDREVVNMQLLESHRSIVSGSPGVRIGKFITVTGNKLREVRWQIASKHARIKGSYWTVTLHGDEKLPDDLLTCEKLETIGHI